MSQDLTCLGPHGEVHTPSDALVALVDLLRRRLRMEVAWLGRLDGDLLVLQVLCGKAQLFGLGPGCTLRRGDSLFGQVLGGTLPQLIPDTAHDPRTAHVPSVRDLGIGAYAAAPVLDIDGRVYGLIGCLHRQAQESLSSNDLRFLQLLAAFLTDYVSDLRKMWEARSAVWHQVHNLIDTGSLTTYYQPIIELTTGRILAVEALTRLPDRTQSPAALFEDAAAAGLGPELETAAIKQALTDLPRLPTGIRMAVNAAPSTVTNGIVDLLLDTGAPEQLAVEITEHEQAHDNPQVLAAAARLRSHGILVAVDDLGTCYSGLELLLLLHPDIIKIDGFITRTMSSDPAHRAVAAGITMIAEEIGSKVIAEGIETTADLTAARTAGICAGQGYLLGRPTPDLATACHPAAGSLLARTAAAGS
ncbi:EAL domain-containing protein [Frankia sp. AgB1.9]|uniref:sensor domain-containing phosphodiesterase n=1 Tax=unclassified Frankia TaxID=2632575 RepID=UPI0019343BED|nr:MULTISPECIES: EAL domain-containing protein [unclassified Frankia]MBL7489558.1 EAL domain-containing protein [Frankia sp. AgW1.1]MBL7550219.1 EAL domain-containing protein [Frankia sp. AgB1.9]MBL7619880.1 EAL domain-containing protein [Frankia sp. AgB1.8]